MADLPEGWAAKTSSSTGRTYYLNEYTKATQWEKPEPVGPGQVNKNLKHNTHQAERERVVTAFYV